MSDILTKIYYGNTVNQWLIAMAIIFGVLMVAKLSYRFFSVVARKFTAKSKTHLDDIIVDMIEEPIVAAFFVAGVWYALGTLVLSEGIHSTINHIMQFAIILFIAWLVARLFDALCEEYLVPITKNSSSDIDDQMLPIVRKGIKSIVWSMGVIIGLNNAGYDVAALIAGLGIGGLALAMAAKDTVANIFGGFTIFTDKPFSINDRIQVKGYDGTVVEIGIRSTRLKTLAGRIVTIPNSDFASSPVENVSLEPSRKVTLDLGLTYNTAPQAMTNAISILKSIAIENSSVDGEPKVFFSGFGDFSMNIKFIYCIQKGADITQTQSDINMAILTQFNEQHLDFAFPTQTIYTATIS